MDINFQNINNMKNQIRQFNESEDISQEDLNYLYYKDENEQIIAKLLNYNTELEKIITTFYMQKKVINNDIKLKTVFKFILNFQHLISNFSKIEEEQKNRFYEIANKYNIIYIQDLEIELVLSIKDIKFNIIKEFLKEHNLKIENILAHRKEKNSENVKNKNILYKEYSELLAKNNITFSFDEFNSFIKEIYTKK
jgi:hypothetical protein